MDVVVAAVGGKDISASETVLGDFAVVTTEELGGGLDDTASEEGGEGVRGGGERLEASGGGGDGGGGAGGVGRVAGRDAGVVVDGEEGDEGWEDTSLEEFLEEGVVRLEEAEGGQGADFILQADVLDDDVDEAEELLAATGGGEGGAGALGGDREAAKTHGGGVRGDGIAAAEVGGEPGGEGGSVEWGRAEG